VFPPDAVEAVYRHSRGFPRLINTVCENALITAYARQIPTISVEVVEDVAREFRLDRDFFSESEVNGAQTEMDVQRAAKVLRDLYSALRKPATRTADLNVPVSLETSEYEQNI
jgi:general secretion pathway protein A